MTTTAQPNEHLHGRPHWDCRACGHPWPCAIAKASLAAEFERSPSVLTVYMMGQMHDAFVDLTADGTPPPPDLYERFLSWIRRG